MPYKGKILHHKNILTVTHIKKKKKRQSNRKWVKDINRQVTDETYEKPLKFASIQENTN